MNIQITDLPKGHKIDRIEIAFLHDDELQNDKLVTVAPIVARQTGEPSEPATVPINDRPAKGIPEEMETAQF